MAHRRDLQRGTHINAALQNAYNKYGKDLMRIDVLRETEPDDVREWEQLYINELKPNYNISQNADCALFDEAVIQKRIEAVSRPVICLNTGVVYPSVYEAARSNGVPEHRWNQMFTAIKLKYKFIGMFWAYKHEQVDLESVINDYNEREALRKTNAAKATSKIRSRPVVRLSDGVVFSSAKVAAEQLGLARTAIFDACKLLQKKAGSFWCYQDSPISREEAELLHKNKLQAKSERQSRMMTKKLSKRLLKISTGEVFDNIKSAAKAHGVGYTNFSRDVKMGLDVCGSKWEMLP
jgi:hypothetical protein